MEKQEEIQNENLIQNINENTVVNVIESLCMNCHQNGETRLMLTKIPYFKEVLISSFQCEECGYKNSEIQPAGELSPYGYKYILKMIRRSDLDRDIIFSEHANIKFLELELEIPCNKGSINTIEGLLRKAYDGMIEGQDQRRLMDTVNAEKIDKFLENLKSYLEGNRFPLTLELEDPSGNSFVKNPYAPSDDPQMKKIKFTRTMAMNHKMGFYPEQDDKDQNQENDEKERIEQNLAHRFDFNKPLTEDVKGESLNFELQCHCCLQMGSCKMCSSSIPYFKEIIIMSFLCENCGAHSTEVKTGGALSAKGRKITLKVESDDDLKRDLFKSDSAYLCIPELELELEYGTLGGLFTTVEGILEKISSHLKENNPFMCGDSIEGTYKQEFAKFFKGLEDLKALQRSFTLIIDDPLDNSFIQNPFYPDHDPRIVVEIYERTEEQNDEFGILHMKTENYS